VNLCLNWNLLLFLFTISHTYTANDKWKHAFECFIPFKLFYENTILSFYVSIFLFKSILLNMTTTFLTCMNYSIGQKVYVSLLTCTGPLIILLGCEVANAIIANLPWQNPILITKKKLQIFFFFDKKRSCKLIPIANVDYISKVSRKLIYQRNLVGLLASCSLHFNQSAAASRSL
jgi:hypothetical protein